MVRRQRKLEIRVGSNHFKDGAYELNIFFPGCVIMQEL